MISAIDVGTGVEASMNNMDMAITMPPLSAQAAGWRAGVKRLPNHIIAAEPTRLIGSEMITLITIVTAAIISNETPSTGNAWPGNGSLNTVSVRPQNAQSGPASTDAMATLTSQMRLRDTIGHATIHIMMRRPWNSSAAVSAFMASVPRAGRSLRNRRP